MKGGDRERTRALGEAEIVGLNQAVTIGLEAHNNCQKIKETNPLDPNTLEYKYYAPGVGLVLVEKDFDVDSLLDPLSSPYRTVTAPLS